MPFDVTAAGLGRTCLNLEETVIQGTATHDKTSIKTRLTLTVLVTVSLLMIAMSLNLYFSAHSMVSESIMAQQSTLVTDVADQLNGRIELARHQLMLATTDINLNTAVGFRYPVDVSSL